MHFNSDESMSDECSPQEPMIPSPTTALSPFGRVSNPETLCIPNSVELSHSETILSSNLVFLFFPIGDILLLPSFWPPFEKSSVITGGIYELEPK